MINVVTSSRYKIGRKKIREMAASLLSEKGISQSYILNIVFVGRNKMKSLTKKYKHEEDILPILSFPYRQEKPPDKLLGEIFICYPQAVILAAQRNKKVDDIMLQLINHGIDNLLK